MKPLDLDVDSAVTLTTEDFNEFLARQDAEHACDACGLTVEWYMRTQENKPLITYMPYYAGQPSAELFYSLFCPNCGNTRLFNAIYVAAVVKQYRESKNG